MNILLHLVYVLTIAGGLHFKHFCVATAHCGQLVVTSLFGNPAVVKYYDAIRHPHGGESMRNKQRHLSRGEFSKAMKNLELTAGVERCRWFVENQKLRIA